LPPYAFGGCRKCGGHKSAALNSAVSNSGLRLRSQASKPSRLRSRMLRSATKVRRSPSVGAIKLPPACKNFWTSCFVFGPLGGSPGRVELKEAWPFLRLLGLNCADHRNAAGSCWRMRRGWSYHQRPRSHWWDESCVVRHKKFGRLMTGSGHSRPMELIGQLTTRPQHIQ
jgi:hypothetical protein